MPRPATLTLLLTGAVVLGGTAVAADLDLDGPRTQALAVSRTGAAPWQAAFAASWYAGNLSDQVPVFVTGNGAVVVRSHPDGTPATASVYRGTTRRVSNPKQWPGGWLAWDRTHVPLPRPRIDLAGAAWPNANSVTIRTAYLDHTLPATDREDRGLQVRTVLAAPISEDSTERPRAVVLGTLIRNTSTVPLDGVWRLDPGTNWHLDGTAAEVAFALPPGGSRWITACLTLTEDERARMHLATRDGQGWLTATARHWQRTLGTLDLPAHPMAGELLLRCEAHALQSGLLNEQGEPIGVSYGLATTGTADNLRDLYYTILPAMVRDPVATAPWIGWFHRWSTRHVDAKYPAGTFHSLGNTLNATVLAGLYYEATGDTARLRTDPTLLPELTATLDGILATHRAGTPWLFPSRYISDGYSLGDYHTGSNACLWKALTGMAAVLEAVGGQEATVQRWREAATHVAAALRSTCTTVAEGGGRRFVEGVNADGTIPVDLHDGEESDTALLPFYGFCAPDDATYRATLRFAVSAANPAYCPETRAIAWEDYGPKATIKPVGGLCAKATFPSYVTALGSCATVDELLGPDGRLTELCRATDVNGTMWWWPYGTTATRSKDLRRTPFDCGWAAGTYACVLGANFLGLTYHAPTRTLQVRPSPLIGDYTWKDFPLGSGRFTVAWKGGVATVTNLGDAPVEVRGAAGTATAGPTMTVTLPAARP